MFYVFAPIAMTTDVRSVEPLPLNPAPYVIAEKFVLIATEFALMPLELVLIAAERV